MIMTQNMKHTGAFEHGFVRVVGKPAYVMFENERLLVCVNPFTLIGYKYDGDNTLAYPLEIIHYDVFVNWVRK